MMERYADAATAYGRATTLNGSGSVLWTDYAKPWLVQTVGASKVSP